MSVIAAAGFEILKVSHLNLRDPHPAYQHKAFHFIIFVSPRKLGFLEFRCKMDIKVQTLALIMALCVGDCSSGF